jgi:hypothetical protein
MLFSISVSFTNKNVNHIVIFELKKLLKKYYKMDELGVKLNGPVSSWNLDSGKSNVPGYTTETNSPLLAGTASSILNSSSVSVSGRTWFCGVGHLELVRWIMTSYFTMTSFKLQNHEFQIQFRYMSNNYITSVFHWNVTIWLGMKWSHDNKSDVSHPNKAQIRTCTCLHDDVRCKQSMA